jgi:hypothetical protein
MAQANDNPADLIAAMKSAPHHFTIQKNIDKVHRQLS